jgi:catechol 2,3-dioxygenase-like lactoylglutathione lyase family enzyme
VAGLRIQADEGPKDRQSGPGRIAAFTDPNGVTIEFLDGADVRETLTPSPAGA